MDKQLDPPVRGAGKKSKLGRGGLRGSHAILREGETSEKKWRAQEVEIGHERRKADLISHGREKGFRYGGAT